MSTGSPSPTPQPLCSHRPPLSSLAQAATKPALINATLLTLQRYVTWIPDRYIFETRLLETLIMKYLPRPEFRTNTLQVLTEVGSLVKPAYDRVFEQLYLGVMGQLVRFLPSDANLKRAYEDGSAEEQLFLRHLALFLSGFYRAHVELLEPEPFRPVLLAGMNYLVQISDVSDTEIFKICLEYWLRLAADLYQVEAQYAPTLPAMGVPMQGMGGAPGDSFGGASGRPAGGVPNPRKAMYAETLSRVREVMITHMAKPEEVLIEEDDSGEIVRETTKDTDAIAMYKVRGGGGDGEECVRGLRGYGSRRWPVPPQSHPAPSHPPVCLLCPLPFPLCERR
jgi:exportin-1